MIKDLFVRIGGDVDCAAPHVDLHDRVPQNDLAARLSNIGGELLGDHEEVDDSRLGDQQS